MTHHFLINHQYSHLNAKVLFFLLKTYQCKMPNPSLLLHHLPKKIKNVLKADFKPKKTWHQGRVMLSNNAQVFNVYRHLGFILCLIVMCTEVNKQNRPHRPTRFLVYTFIAICMT